MVETSSLLEMAGRLKGLQQEFENADQVADAYSSGAPRLENALHEFANNWADKRRIIGDMIHQVAECVEQAALVYDETENSIAAGFGSGSA